MRSILTIGLLATGLAASTACTTTIRNISHGIYTENGAYIGYWEGVCKPILGCGVGDGKVQYCKLQPDNSLQCEEQTEVSALLARDNN